MATLTILFGGLGRRIAKPSSYRELLLQARTHFPMMGSVASVIVLIDRPEGSATPGNSARYIELDENAFHSVKDGESVYLNVQEPITKEYILPLPNEDPNVPRKSQMSRSEIETASQKQKSNNSNKVSHKKFHGSRVYHDSNALSQEEERAGGDAFGNGWGAASECFRRSAALIPSLKECNDAIGLSVGESNGYPDEQSANEWKPSPVSQTAQQGVWSAPQQSTEGISQARARVWQAEALAQAEGRSSSSSRNTAGYIQTPTPDSPRTFRMSSYTATTGRNRREDNFDVESTANPQPRLAGSTEAFPQYQDPIDASRRQTGVSSSGSSQPRGSNESAGRKSPTGVPKKLRASRNNADELSHPMNDVFQSQITAGEGPSRRGPQQPSDNASRRPGVTSHGSTAGPLPWVHQQGGLDQPPPTYMQPVAAHPFATYGMPSYPVQSIQMPGPPIPAVNHGDWHNGGAQMWANQQNHMVRHESPYPPRDQTLHFDPAKVTTGSPMMPQKRGWGNAALQWRKKLVAQRANKDDLQDPMGYMNGSNVQYNQAQWHSRMQQMPMQGPRGAQAQQPAQMRQQAAMQRPHVSRPQGSHTSAQKQSGSCQGQRRQAPNDIGKNGNSWYAPNHCTNTAWVVDHGWGTLRDTAADSYDNQQNGDQWADNMVRGSALSNKAAAVGKWDSCGHCNRCSCAYCNECKCFQTQEPSQSVYPTRKGAPQGEGKKTWGFSGGWHAKPRKEDPKTPSYYGRW